MCLCLHIGNSAVFYRHIYGGQSFLDAFFGAINKIINLVVLKYENTSVQALMNANLFFTITVYYCFVLIEINAMMCTLSFTSQYIWQFIKSFESKFTREDKLVIFGFNQNNTDIYNSDETHNKTIMDDISSENCMPLYFKNI